MPELMKRVPAKLCVEQGVCVTCGLEPLVTRKLGARCRAVFNAGQTRRYRELRGIPLDAPKFTHSKSPKAEVSRQCKKQRKNAANGLCPRCGEPAAEGTKQCLRHLKISRASRKASYRRKAGLPENATTDFRTYAR